MREGLTAADDRLPDRFFEDAIDSGPMTGVKVDRDAFGAAVAQHYEAMGWDEAGVPTTTTLIEHHLEWVPPTVEAAGAKEGIAA